MAKVVPWLWVAFLRLVALAYVAAAIVVWAYVLGFEAPGVAAYLELPLASRASVTVLCVMVPLSAIGLWTAHAGGQVIWTLTAAFQVLAVLGGWLAPLPLARLLPATLGALAIYCILVALRFATVRKDWRSSVNGA